MLRAAIISLGLTKIMLINPSDRSKKALSSNFCAYTVWYTLAHSLQKAIGV